MCIRDSTLTWTFTLREENWVDNNGEVVAPVTAQDFVDALQYVLTLSLIHILKQ